MSDIPADQIHAAVRERYGAIARDGGSCCGPSAGDANVEFRKGQIEALPVADGTVDVILSNNGLTQYAA